MLKTQLIFTLRLPSLKLVKFQEKKEMLLELSALCQLKSMDLQLIRLFTNF